MKTKIPKIFSKKISDLRITNFREAENTRGVFN